MHTAPIWRIGADKTCKWIATASRDKTVRLWTPPDVKGQELELVQTFRAMIDDGNEGKFRSVAVSPNGKWVAAGAAAWGKPGGENWIYVFDRESGDIVKAIGPLKSVPNDIAFNRNGEKLAVALHSGYGHIVWDTTDEWKEIGQESYRNGSLAHSYGIAFDTQDRLYTVAFSNEEVENGVLRRYKKNEYSSKNGQPEKIVLTGETEPYAIAIHAKNSNLIAIAYADKSYIDVFYGNDEKIFNKPIYRASAPDSSEDLFAVSWAKEGKRLFGGGKPADELKAKGNPYPLYYWDLPTEDYSILPKNSASSPKDLKRNDSLIGPGNSVIDLVPCGDNKIALGSQDPGIFILNNQGDRLAEKSSIVADMRGKLGEELMVSVDGNKVRFNLAFSKSDYVTFDLQAETVRRTPREPSYFYKSDTESIQGIAWRDENKPPIFNKQFILGENSKEQPRSLAIAPDKINFVLGAEWSINLWCTTCQKQAKARTPVPSTTWGVNIPPDGNVVVAAHGDGTIRWYRLSDLKPLLALFVDPSDPERKWVAWTPKGYYLATGGAEFIGWHVNNKQRDKKAKFVKIGTYRENFARPGIVKLILKTFDEDQAINEDNRLRNILREADGENRPNEPTPDISIDNPPKEFNDFVIDLPYSVEPPPGQKIKKIEVWVQGKLFQGSKYKSGNKSNLQIKLKNEETTKIFLRAYDEKLNFGDSNEITLEWTGPKVKEKDLPNLYAVLIGVSEYKNPKLKLEWAKKDAIDLDVLLKAQGKAQGGKVFNKVVTKLIIDSNATEKGIKGGLTWLYRVVTENDFALFYYSGHGHKPYHNFHLIPVDGDITDFDSVVSTGVGSETLLKWIGSLPGKKIVILDACRSQSAFDGVVVSLGGLENAMAGNNGTVIFSSSASGELSFECRKEDMCENGYFTHILLRGLKGEAEEDDPLGFIQANELRNWMEKEVEKFTKDKLERPQKGNVVASQEWQNIGKEVNLAWWNYNPNASSIP